MALGNITLGTKTYSDLGNGVYINSAKAIDDVDKVTVTRANVITDTTQTPVAKKQDFHIRRELLLKDANGNFNEAFIDFRFRANSAVTSATIDTYVGELSTWITAAIIDQIRSGLV